MTEKQRAKLELIRIEGICRMLLSKIDKDTLSEIVENVTQISSEDIGKAIYKLSRYQLIQVIERLGTQITEKDINNAYEQYRYGLKPGFTLYSINSKGKRLSEELAFSYISETLKSKNYSPDENIKDIQAKLFSNISENVVEFSFSYLNKHSYLNENQEPAFVYEYEECFAWIDVNNGFLAIKNVPDKVSNILKHAFSIAYSTEFTNIKLTKKLIRDIFGDKNIRKGTFFKPNASMDEAEKLVVSDSRFSEKQALQNSVSGYDMSGIFLTEAVGESDNNTLGINCEKGKLYLTRNVSASVFRDWSVKKIEAIISYLSDITTFSDFGSFQAKNVMDNKLWEEFSKPEKELVEKILYSVYIACQNKQDNSPVDCSPFEIKKALSKHLYHGFKASCHKCNEPFIPRCVCGSPVLNITKKNDLLCTECGETINTIVCEEGHPHEVIDVSEILLFYPSYDLLKRIKVTLYKYFDIDFNGSFYIQNGQLTVLPEIVGGLITVDSIPELKTVSSTIINESEYEVLLSQLKNVREKCRKTTNKHCSTCTLNDERVCIMKIFTTFPTYRPSPHQALEFGDVNFSVTLDGESYELVGVAKSATKGEVLNLSESAARDMLQQILSFTHDARIGIIAAICPMHFHDQLVEELRYIAKLTSKPIVILDDRFMVQQYKAYLAKKSSIT